MTTNKDEKKHAEPTFCQFESNSRPGHKRMLQYIIIYNKMKIKKEQ